MIKKIFGMVFLTVGLFANYLENINFNKREAMQVYQTGIYDTYIQIGKFIRQAMVTGKIKEYKGKIIVAYPTKRLPIQEILYYSVLANKNFFNSQIAYNTKTKRNYIVFNAYDREADAQSAVNKLRNLGINAIKVYNGEWIKNPMIVKSLAMQLANTQFGDFPVKVIIKKKYILVPQNNNIAYNAPQTQKINYITKKIVKKRTYERTINKLKKLITLITHIKNEGQPIVKGNYIAFKFKRKIYKKGDYIQGFKITNTCKKYYYYKGRKYMKVCFKFDNYNNYHLVFRVPIGTKVIKNTTTTTIKIKKERIKEVNLKKLPEVQDTSCNLEAQPIEQTIIANKMKSTQTTNATTTTMTTTVQTTQSVQTGNFYTCNFNKLMVLYDKNLQPIYRNLTNYKGVLKVMKIATVNKDGKIYIKFQANGLPIMAMKKIQWDNVCKK